jgi:hypothetical protein
VRRRKVRRAKAPVIPLTSRGQPPSYFELLQEAVLTLKEAGTGASLPEIRRQLQRRYKGRFDKAGKVICKRGYRYKFNAPKVSKPKPTKSASSCSGASSAPSDANNDSRTSASSDSSTSGTTNRSGKSSAKDGEGVPKDVGEESGEDSASSTASRRASSKKTLSNLPSSRKCTSGRCNFSKN